MKKFFTRFLLLFPVIAISVKQDVAGQVLLNPATQPKFIKQLPIPTVLDARGGGTVNKMTAYRAY